MSSAHLLVQVVAMAAIGALLLVVLRWVRAQSPLVGMLLAAGVLLRAASGLLLFWVSYLDLDWLAGVHVGEGFWAPAIDGQTYFALASDGVSDGVRSISSHVPSPGYVRLLALWMLLVGVSPASAFFLHLVLYVLLGALLTRLFRPTGAWRTDRPCLLLLAAFTFSPALLIHSTQPLKDDLFAFLIATACVAALLMVRMFTRGETGWFPARSRAAAGALLLGSIYLLAGIRVYFSFLFCGALAVGLAFGVWRAQPSYRPRLAAAAAGILLLSYAVWLAGAGPAGAVVLQPLGDVIPGVVPAADRDRGAVSVIQTLHALREGFEQSGGGTNVTRWSGRAGTGTGVPGLAGRLSLGLALTFVPVSLLRALSLVDMDGGRGLIVITDLDTIFLNVTFVAIGAVIYRQRHRIGADGPYILLLVTLVLVITVLMAYIVTNFGTLFRLRLMLAVPFWMLLLGLSEGPAESSVPAACGTCGEQSALGERRSGAAAAWERALAAVAGPSRRP